MSDLTVEQLSDGRLQMFKVDLVHDLYSRWKTTTSPDGPWSNWSAFPQPGPLENITAGRLEDGRIQLFATDSDNDNWSCWKTTTDPNSAWTDWTKF